VTGCPRNYWVLPAPPPPFPKLGPLRPNQRKGGKARSVIPRSCIFQLFQEALYGPALPVEGRPAVGFQSRLNPLLLDQDHVSLRLGCLQHIVAIFSTFRESGRKVGSRYRRPFSRAVFVSGWCGFRQCGTSNNIGREQNGRGHLNVSAPCVGPL